MARAGVRALLALAGFLGVLGGARAEDAVGCRDPNRLPRPPGFQIDACAENDNVLEVRTDWGKTLEVAGRRTHLRYSFERECAGTCPSPLQIVRHYERALAALGGKRVHGDDESYASFATNGGGARTWVALEVTGTEVGGLQITGFTLDVMAAGGAAPAGQAGLSLPGAAGNVGATDSPMDSSALSRSQVIDTPRSTQTPCTFTASVTSVAVPSDGGSSTVTVACPAGCAWAPSSNRSWLTVSGGGAGSGSFTLTASSNPSGDSRTGVVTVAGRAVLVLQGGARDISCTASAKSTPSVAIASSSAIGDIFALCTDSGSGSGGSLTVQVVLSASCGLSTPVATVSGGSGSMAVAGTPSGGNAFLFTVSNLVRPLRSIAVTGLTADTASLDGAATVTASLGLVASFGAVQVINSRVTVATIEVPGAVPIPAVQPGTVSKPTHLRQDPEIP